MVSSYFSWVWGVGMHLLFRQRCERTWRTTWLAVTKTSVLGSVCMFRAASWGVRTISGQHLTASLSKLSPWRSCSWQILSTLANFYVMVALEARNSSKEVQLHWDNIIAFCGWGEFANTMAGGNLLTLYLQWGQGYWGNCLCLCFLLNMLMVFIFIT